MNCRDIALLLDDADIRKLTSAERTAVGAHLAGCSACADAWQAHEALCSYPIPAMRSELPARIRQRLRLAPTPTRSRRLPGRPILVGAFLLAGAAAAMVALEPWKAADNGEAAASISAPERPLSAADGSGTAGDVLPGAAIRPDEPAARDAQTVADNSAAAAGGEAFPRLIVLPARHTSPAQEAAWIFEDVRGAFVRALQSKPDVDLVALGERDMEAPDEPSSAREGRGSLPDDHAADRAIASRLGGTHFVRVWSQATDYEATRSLLIHIYYEGPSGGNRLLYHIGEAEHPWADAASTGESLAGRVYLALFPESARPDLLSRVTDTSLPDHERGRALEDLSRRGSLSENEIAAALELARTALSPETRRRVWQILGATADPALSQPLTDALLYDPEPQVRSQAAAALAPYLEEPNVRAALEAVAANDPDSSVRLRAGWQLMTDAERRALISDALNDSALPLQERTAPLMLTLRESRSDLLLDRRTLSILVGLARDSGDPDLDLVATREVEREPDFVEFLLEKLEADDPLVRVAAHHALTTHHLGAPGVRDALAAMLERDRAALRQP